MRLFFTILSCCFYFIASSQTQTEWAQVVNWDGVSHWSKYIKVRAAWMGPNALAIPAIANGSVDSTRSATITTQLHFSPGDKTQSIVLYGNYCLVKDLVSFDISYIPVEFYTMSDEMKKERHVYYKYYNDKKARGDVLLATTIQLFNKWRKNIHLALRVGYRMPSSSGFGAARFIDGMGYHIDISMAKPFKTIPLKVLAMAGFYCWQIEQEDFRQNDAFLFGTGMEWYPESWRFQTYIAGYLGYIENSGDKPVVFRASAEKRLGRSSLLLKFQQGLHDLKYSTVEFGGKYYFR